MGRKREYRILFRFSLFFYLQEATMLESNFQSKLIKELKERFPDCIVLKNDPNYISGIPDLLVLYKNKWAMLEVKRSSGASTRPLQKYYVEKTNSMSFARFINPENKEDVLNELERTFES